MCGGLGWLGPNAVSTSTELPASVATRAVSTMAWSGVVHSDPSMGPVEYSTHPSLVSRPVRMAVTWTRAGPTLVVLCAYTISSTGSAPKERPHMLTEMRLPVCAPRVFTSRSARPTVAPCRTTSAWLPSRAPAASVRTAVATPSVSGVVSRTSPVEVVAHAMEQAPALWRSAKDSNP